MNDLTNYKLLTSGKISVTQASQGPTAALAAVSGKTIIVMGAILTVTLAGAAGGALVNILDGGTAIESFDANAVNAYMINFGNRGYPLTQGNAFQISVSGAGGNQATANILAWGLVSA